MGFQGAQAQRDGFVSARGNNLGHFDFFRADRFTGHALGAIIQTVNGLVIRPAVDKDHLCGFQSSLGGENFPARGQVSRADVHAGITTCAGVDLFKKLVHGVAPLLKVKQVGSWVNGIRCSNFVSERSVSH